MPMSPVRRFGLLAVEPVDDPVLKLERSFSLWSASSVVGKPWTFTSRAPALASRRTMRLEAVGEISMPIQRRSSLSAATNGGI